MFMKKEGLVQLDRLTLTVFLSVQLFSKWDVLSLLVIHVSIGHRCRFSTVSDGCRVLYRVGTVLASK